MSKHFDWYPAQAHTKDEVIKAIKKKQHELEREQTFFREGLRKIDSLEEKAFYILTYQGEINFFVQCLKFGRDHVEFRVFAADLSLEKIQAKTSIIRVPDHMSLAWSWDWETKAADEKDAVLYVSWEHKSRWFEKLLKGKYTNKKEANSDILLPQPPDTDTTGQGSP